MGRAMGFIGDRPNNDQLEAGLARAGTFEKEAKLKQSPLELRTSPTALELHSSPNN
jgi:hypothetical protein